MQRYLTLLLTLLTIISCNGPQSATPQTNFDKELAWWKDARYGLFIHWGISSLEGIEISWPRRRNPEKYDRLAQRFNPIDFDADKWIDVAENCGMKYIVFTTKHHDGFSLWDSKVNPHNIMKTPYGKDICKQLADAAHRRGMRLGWYLSVREWNDSTCNHETLNHLYVEKLKGEIKELLTSYGKIDILWFDTDGIPSSADPQTIFDYCRKIQPDIIINNRLCPLHANEAHAYTSSYGMYATPEQMGGGYGDTPWESCSTSTTSRQWSIKYNDPPRPSKDMTWELISVAGGNGNLLMNIGPDSLGVIPQDYVDTLKLVNNWIKANEGVIYGTKGGPWKPSKRYVSTRKDKTVNIVIKDGNDIAIPYNSEIDFEKAYIASCGEPVQSQVRNDTIFFTIPDKFKGAPFLVIRLDMKSDANRIGLIAPFSTSGSLAYNRKICATSSTSDTYKHCPQSAVDDDYATRWVVGRRKDYDSSLIFGHYYQYFDPINEAVFNDSANLEVDLEQEKNVTRIKVITGSNIARLYVEYKHDEKWMTAKACPWLKADSTVQFTLKNPISARNWRLRMSGGGPQLSIREFQIFDK